PGPPKKGGVRGHLMLSQGAQNGTCLRIDGGKIVELAAKMNRAVPLQRQAKVNFLTRGALEVRKQAGHCVGVLPNIPARAFTATHSYPTVKPTVAEPVGGRGRKDGGVQERAIEKPIR